MWQVNGVEVLDFVCCQLSGSSPAERSRRKSLTEYAELADTLLPVDPEDPNEELEEFDLLKEG